MAVRSIVLAKYIFLKHDDAKHFSVVTLNLIIAHVADLIAAHVAGKRRCHSAFKKERFCHPVAVVTNDANNIGALPAHRLVAVRPEGKEECAVLISKPLRSARS
jgi:hypothetical protein